MRLAVVADKEPASRRALASALEAAGLTPVECSDGRRLWALLADNRRTEVVFADALLEGLDGGELARRLAVTRELRHIPVVVTSAKQDSATVGRLLAIGVAAVIGKSGAAAEVQTALAAAARAAERHVLSSSSSSTSGLAAARPRRFPSTPNLPEVTS